MNPTTCPDLDHGMGARHRAEHHLLILWEHARSQQKRILAELTRRLTIRAAFGIRWSPSRVAENFSRFYGQRLPPGSFKEEHCGAGRFLVVIVRDPAPRYEQRATSKGARSVNVNIFDLKQAFREWTGGGHRVHATDSETETRHDLALLFGVGYEALLGRLPARWNGTVHDMDVDLVGAAGWKDLRQLFVVVNDAQEYLVMRNFEGLPDHAGDGGHDDIDLLTASSIDLAYVLNARKVYPQAHRVHYAAMVGGREVRFDLREPGDCYYDEAWQRAMLQRRCRCPAGFYTPSAHDYFYSLLYHALVHKPAVAPDYAQRLVVLGSSIGVELPPPPWTEAGPARCVLVEYLTREGYEVCRPRDTSVFFDQNCWSGARDVRLQAESMGRDDDESGRALEVLRSVEDRSMASESLRRALAQTGRPAALDPRAANLLRPLAESLAGRRVLLLGARSSSRTRYLAEEAGRLTVVEPDPRWAALARARCEDRRNVEILTRMPAVGGVGDAYDAVVMVDGLAWREREVTPGPDSFDCLIAALEDAVGVLGPEGVVVVAVDNPLSLGRLGAMSAHSAPQTTAGSSLARPRLGRTELARALRSARLGHASWYFPLPRVEAPSVVVTQSAFEEDPALLHNLLGQLATVAHDGALRSSADAVLTWRAIVDNRLLGDLADGFLVVGRAERVESAAAASIGEVRAYLWATDRQPALCKQTQIMRTQVGLEVRREPLYGLPIPAWMRLARSEPLRPGELLFNRLPTIVARAGWTVDHLADWVRPLHAVLQKSIRSTCGGQMLPGWMLDATPFNLVGGDDGYELFDLEWSIEPEVDLDYVLWRGVYHSMIRIGQVAASAPSTPSDCAVLAAEVVRRLTNRSARTTEWLRNESELQVRVAGIATGAAEARSVVACREHATRTRAAADQYAVAADEPRDPQRLRIAVVLHLFYPEYWSEFAQALSALPERTQLFVTTSPEKLGWVRRIVLTDRPDAVVVGLPNRGRDLGALVGLFESHDLSRYDFVLKLHSKRSPHLPEAVGQRWRRELLKHLLPDGRVTDMLRALEASPDIGLAGPQQWLADIRSTQGFETNSAAIHGLAERIGVAGDPFDLPFVAGTMFWVRGAVLAQLAALGLTQDDFEPEAGQLDGTLAHALERAFGLLARKLGWRVAALPSVDGRGDDAAGAMSQASRALQRWLDARHADEAQRAAIRERLAGSKSATSLAVFVLDRAADDADHVATCRSLEGAAGLLPSVRTIVIGPRDAPGKLPGSARYVRAGPGQTIDVLNAQASEIDATWLLVVEAGEIFTPCGLARVALELMDAESCRAVLADEIVRGPDGSLGALLRPAVNLDLTLSFPVAMARHVMLRRDAWRRIGGFDRELPGALELDLLLRMFEDGGLAGLGHVAEPLIVGAAPNGAANDDETKAILGHLRRRGYERARILPRGVRRYRVDYGHNAQPLVSIIVPTRNELAMLRRCVESLLEATTYPNYEVLIVDNGSDEADARAWLDGVAAIADARVRVLSCPQPFNFSAVNNKAARAARGEYLVLLNNDTAVLDGSWLDAMLNHALRPEVGVVGAKLLYPDGSVQHAGVVLGLRGPAEHAFCGEPRDAAGYMQRLVVDQNYSAVTAACLMIRREVYDQVGGMDEESFAVSYNDVDLCLKVGAAGYLTVWTPDAVLLHEGSVSQKRVDAAAAEERRERFVAEQDALYARWLPQIARDPAYNPNLSLTGRGFDFEADTSLVCRPLPWRPLPVVLAHPADRYGCGEYRVLQPMAALHEAGLIDGIVRDEPLLPAELARLDPDVVVLQRQIGDHQLEAMRRMHAFGRAFRVYELDDYLPRLPHKSAFRAGIPKDAMRSLRRGLSYVDRFVVSTPALAEAFDGLHCDIRVVPNRLAPARWDGLASRRRRGRKPRVGWAGGAGHGGDLELIVDVVKALSDEVEWVFFGLCPEPLLDLVHEVHAGVGIEKYPAKLASLDLDLGLAPLEDNLFNACKSNIRLLEYGVLGVPVVCSDLRCYREDGLPVVRVRNRFKDWVDAIRAHTRDPDHAARQGDALRARVQAEWMLRGEHLQTWLDAWTRR